MIIGIDARFGAVLGGLGTYTRSLVSSLVQRSDPWSLTLFVRDEREEWLSPLRSKPNVRLIEAPFDHYSFAEQTAFPNVLQDAACDLLLFSHFNVPLVCGTPFVCVIHDLILHRFPNEAPLMKRLAYRFLFSRAVHRAQKIVAVSEFTKSDLREFFGERIAAKTDVVHNGISPIFKKASMEACDALRQKHRLHSPFLLYVGNCKEHKNVATLLRAFRQAGLSGIELVCVSGGRECAHLPRVDGVRFISDVTEADLPALYSASLGCVTATLLEGFCLPLLEAMACRVPVLATLTGPIPEVCDGHALLVEPTAQALSEGLRTIVLDPSVRSEKRLDAAEKHARGYTWEKAAEHIVGIISPRRG